MPSDKQQPDRPDASEAGRQTTPSVRAFTVAQLAERYAVKLHVVLRWIRNGELRAIDVREKLKESKKPRWKILPEDLAAFEDRRAAKPVASPQPRRKPKAAAPPQPMGRRW